MRSLQAVIKRIVSLAMFLLAMATFLHVQSTVQAQIVDPLNEYTNPDEIVAFDKSTSYAEAIEVINTFAQEYEDKFIVDNTGYSGTIGVNLPAMHWKDALQYIMRFQDLELTEYEEFYEITVPEPEPTGQSGTVTGGNQTSAEGELLLPTTQTREIRINATFFEGNRRALQEIGVDWSTLSSNAPDELGSFVGAEGTETVPSGDFSDQFVSVNSFNASSVSQNAFNSLVNFGELGAGISVQALFRAFEADNLGKILATPSVKVVDGEEGNIQVGQDFSIKQRDIAGNVIDNFQSTGTILNVTPQIITQNDTSFIYLNLDVERSTVQPDVVSTIINKQEASTSAILLDGESTYVAGLYRTEESNVRRGVPILKDLPGWFFGLKYLFGYNSKDFSENELIIILQAELIDPVSVRMRNQRLGTTRDVLNQTRDRMRTDLDRVFSQEEPSMIGDDPQAEVNIEEQSEVVEPDSLTAEEDTVAANIVEEEPVLEDELTMKVQKPELMTVVPKAFSLDEFLNYQSGGMEDSPEITNGEMRYFVIGGSFLVPDNAENFQKMLEDEGYDTQILFHPETRFNYVAYEAYANYEQAVERTLEIRDTINEDAWIFKLQPE